MLNYHILVALLQSCCQFSVDSKLRVVLDAPYISKQPNITLLDRVLTSTLLNYFHTLEIVLATRKSR